MREQSRRNSKKQRLTRSEKEANQKAWYKDQMDMFDRISLGNLNRSAFSFSNVEGGILFQQGGRGNQYRRMKSNYDLFNNIIDTAEFNYMIKPFGEEFGEMPANFTNRDILSPKLKALFGIEMKRPFEWRIFATNEEATSRREKVFFEGIRDYVVSSIMNPIRMQLEQQAMESQQGRELTQDEIKTLQQEVEGQLKAMTPTEVKKYMMRDHQDPAEEMGNQVLEYVIQEQDFETKANKIWKHGLISGVEVAWVGIINGDPVLKVINPLKFDFDKSPDSDNIEDGEWACHETRLTPSEVVSYFNEELSDKDIDNIYESYSKYGEVDSTFTFNNEGVRDNGFTIPVLHAEWKSLKAIKFLTTINPDTGEIEEILVDESYTLNKEIGDISIKTMWIPFKYEGYKIKIAEPIYVLLREVPGQYKDLDNLYTCKLSYVGSVFDNLNSEATSLMDRGKYYQHWYNAVQWKIELLMNSDKGKKFFINLNTIPKTQGMTMKQFMYYLETSGIGYLDPTEEGKRANNGDVTNAIKEVDMSLISDIQKYIQLGEYIQRACGVALGVPPELEGQISPDQSVSNTNNTILQSSNVIEPLFDVHNNVKKNILKALLETAKVAISTFPKKKLAYVLDDMSLQLLEVDEMLLDSSTFGLFVANSTNITDALNNVKQLSHAAMQNQKAELSDIIKIYKSKTLQQAEELLLVAEQNRVEREQAMQQQEMEAQKQEAELARQFEREKHQMELDKINLEFDRKEDLEIVKQTILSMGFNEDKDLDKDGTPDILEVAKYGLEADIKMRKQDLDEAKLQHQINKDAKASEQADEKLKVEKQKITLKNNSGK